MPVEELGSPIHVIEGLKGPRGVAINAMGEVVVTEWDGNCVSVFSSSGEKIRSIGSCNLRDLRFLRNPHGVVVNKNKNEYFVADSNMLRIQKFSEKGVVLAAAFTFQDLGLYKMFSRHPRGIAFNNFNKRVYVSCGDGEILVLTPGLTLLGMFGKNGCGIGQFETPRHIACDSTGNVYIADSGNHRIQVFTPQGEFLRMFGGKGEGRGELCMPFGVAIDSSDRIYVSENKNHRVSVFTSDGKFLTFFGSEGDGLGNFRNPYGLAVDSNDVLYVCDDNNRIQLF